MPSVEESITKLQWLMVERILTTRPLTLKSSPSQVGNPIIVESISESNNIAPTSVAASQIKDDNTVLKFRTMKSNDIVAKNVTKTAAPEVKLDSPVAKPTANKVNYLGASDAAKNSVLQMKDHSVSSEVLKAVSHIENGGTDTNLGTQKVNSIVASDSTEPVTAQIKDADISIKGHIHEAIIDDNPNKIEDMEWEYVSLEDVVEPFEIIVRD